MPFSTNMVAQNIASQQAFFGNQMTYAQQLGAAHGTGGSQFMPTYAAPPMMPPGAGGGGLAGGLQQVFTGMSGLGGSMLPGQGQQAAGQISSGLMGMVASPQTPFLGQMWQGMQQQQMMGAAMQQSFNFPSAAGRGFGQGQQRQMGGFLQERARQDIFSSLPELTRLMQGGAEMGMFQAVRDVQQFKQRFNTMVNSLREISRTLGTTMEEAQQFTRQMQQVGVFAPGAQMGAAQQISGMAATSGIGMQQLMQFGGQFGNVMNQAVGANRGIAARAGMGVLAGVGTAAQQGVISEQQIWEATGQTGLAGRQAVGQNLMSMNARFLRRGVGNRMLAAFIDPETGRVNEQRMAMFMSGQISAQEIGQQAQQNVAQFGGRAAWQANVGRYRARFIEETQGLGPVALMMGAMPQGVRDDPFRAKAWMRQRTGATEEQLDIYMPMIENWTQTQRQRRDDEGTQRRHQAYRRWAEERGPEAMMGRLRQRMDDFTKGPFRDLGQNIQRMIEDEVESITDETFGVYEKYLSGPSARRFTEEIRTGRMGGGAAELLAAGKRFQAPGGMPTRGRTSSLLEQGIGVKAAFDAPGSLMTKVARGGEAFKEFVGRGVPAALEPFVRRGVRGTYEALGKIGIVSPNLSIDEEDRKILSGTASDADLGLDAGTLTKWSQDTEMASIIHLAFDKDMSGGTNLDSAIEAVKRKTGLDDKQAKAIVYKTAKENAALKRIKDKMGISLPDEWISNETKTAKESLEMSNKLYKEASKALYSEDSKEWEKIKGVMQQTGIRDAFAKAAKDDFKMGSDSWLNLMTKMEGADADLAERLKNNRDTALNVLHGAMAFGEIQQRQEYTERTVESIAGGLTEPVGKYGTAGGLVSSLKGLKAAIEGTEGGEEGLGLVHRMETVMEGEVEGTKTKKQLFQKVRDLQKMGEYELAGDLEARWKDRQRMKRQTKGRKGQRQLMQRAFMSLVGQYLEPEAAGRITGLIEKEGAGAVGEDALATLERRLGKQVGKEGGLSEEEFAAFQRGRAELGGMLSDKAITEDELSRLGREERVSGETTAGKGGEKAGGRLEDIVDGLGAKGAIASGVQSLNEKWAEGITVKLPWTKDVIPPHK